jgi:hypothetical protein
LTERQVSLGTIAAFGAWFLAIALASMGIVARLVGDDDWAFVALAFGIGFFAAASSLTTRLCMDRYLTLLRDAYRYGKDTADGVRRINA